MTTARFLAPSEPWRLGREEKQVIFEVHQQGTNLTVYRSQLEAELNRLAHKRMRMPSDLVKKCDIATRLGKIEDVTGKIFQYDISTQQVYLRGTI